MPNTAQDHFAACRRFQEYYQTELESIGTRVRVKPPTPGQRVDDYRRESCRDFKRSYLPQTHEFYAIQWRGLPRDALDGLEPRLLQHCCDHANSPSVLGLKPGDNPKPIEKLNPQNGQKFIEFVGPEMTWHGQTTQESFVRNMTRPGRRVVSFATPAGPVSHLDCI